MILHQKIENYIFWNAVQPKIEIALMATDPKIDKIILTVNSSRRVCLISSDLDLCRER